MQPGQEPLERARAQYEDHLSTCRFCSGRGAVCQASKLLRRTYNNLLRAAGTQAESSGPRDSAPPAETSVPAALVDPGS